MRVKEAPSVRDQVPLILTLLSFVGLFFAIPILIVALTDRFGEHDRSSTQDGFVGFQESPRTRGTMSIIFMCLSTLTICSYTVFHGDVPAEKVQKAEDGQNKTLKDEIVIDYISGTHHILVACLTFFMPEIILFRAVREFRSAYAIRESMKGLGYRVWNFRLGFFLNMNGFRDGETILTESTLEAYVTRLRAEGHDIQWEEVVRRIELRDQSNPLLKVIAVFQLLRMAISTFARWRLSFPITPLEITTCAHAVCAVITYAFWFRKPSKVREPINLRQFVVENEGTCDPPVGEEPGSRSSSPECTRQPTRTGSQDCLIEKTPRAESDSSEGHNAARVNIVTDNARAFEDASVKEKQAETQGALARTFGNLDETAMAVAKTMTPVDLKKDAKNKRNFLLTLSIVVGILAASAYAGIHIFIWNLPFASSQEQTLWRTSSLLLFAMVAVTPLAVSNFTTSGNSKTIWHVALNILIFIVVGVNCLARGLIAVLSIYAFWSQPDGIYWELDWSQFLPFFG